MKNEVLVIVFPSIFSKNKASFLISNIKKVLKIQNQKFRKIRKEGDVIIVVQLAGNWQKLVKILLLQKSMNQKLQ